MFSGKPRMLNGRSSTLAHRHSAWIRAKWGYVRVGEVNIIAGYYGKPKAIAHLQKRFLVTQLDWRLHTGSRRSKAAEVGRGAQVTSGPGSLP